ncbi:hypothetical protein, partial [Shinella kummerowiae]|uniref:hypothetical protein n=1 Tax=Shinella kummerowiae TaxID=417745 RepID=UPI001AEE35C8
MTRVNNERYCPSVEKKPFRKIHDNQRRDNCANCTHSGAISRNQTDNVNGGVKTGHGAEQKSA